MMNSAPTIDVKNLSSRKLWELVATDCLPQPQQHMAEQELSLRRHYLEQLGSLHTANGLNRERSFSSMSGNLP